MKQRNRVIFIVLFMLLLPLIFLMFSQAEGLESQVDFLKMVDNIQRVDVRVTPQNTITLDNSQLEEFKRILILYYNNGQYIHDYPTGGYLANLIFVINREYEYQIDYIKNSNQLYFLRELVGNQGILMNIDDEFLRFLEDVI